MGHLYRVVCTVSILHFHTLFRFTALIARLMGITWDLPGADRTQLGPMWATWSLLSGNHGWGLMVDVHSALHWVAKMHLNPTLKLDFNLFISVDCDYLNKKEFQTQSSNLTIDGCCLISKADLRFMRSLLNKQNTEPWDLRLWSVVGWDLWKQLRHSSILPSGFAIPVINTSSKHRLIIVAIIYWFCTKILLVSLFRLDFNNMSNTHNLATK